MSVDDVRGSGDRALAAAAERSKQTAARNIPVFDDLPVADTANLRTTRTYYGTNTTHAMNGRLATVQHPDNRLETHTYEYGNLATIDPSTFTLHPSTPSLFTPDPDGLA